VRKKDKERRGEEEPNEKREQSQKIDWSNKKEFTRTQKTVTRTGGGFQF